VGDAVGYDNANVGGGVVGNDSCCGGGMPRCRPRVRCWCSRPIPDNMGNGAWLALITNPLSHAGPMCRGLQAFPECLSGELGVDAQALKEVRGK
jgi:hypothetical protein